MKRKRVDSFKSTIRYNGTLKTDVNPKWLVSVVEAVD